MTPKVPANKTKTNNTPSSSLKNAFSQGYSLQLQGLTIELMVLAYNQMYNAGHYKKNTIENQYTAQLVGYMELNRPQFERITRNVWHIEREHQHDPDDVILGNTNPNEAKRIDIVVYSWKPGKSKFRYALEAKRIAENDNDLIEYYITKGLLDRFLNHQKNYSNNDPYGGMIGFVIQGSHSSIVTYLNNEINSHPTIKNEILTPAKPILGFSSIYESTHTGPITGTPLRITHLMMKFY